MLLGLRAKKIFLFIRRSDYFERGVMSPNYFLKQRLLQQIRNLFVGKAQRLTFGYAFLSKIAIAVLLKHSTTCLIISCSFYRL